MTADVGRSLRLYWGNESPIPLVATTQEKSIKHNGEPVDITNDDSAGWRALIDKAGVNGIDVEFSGVTDNDTLRADWYAGASATDRRMQTLEIHFPDGGVVSGLFYLNGYTETGKHDEAIMFEAAFLSSGVVTYTPGP